MFVYVMGVMVCDFCVAACMSHKFSTDTVLTMLHATLYKLYRRQKQNEYQVQEAQQIHRRETCKSDEAEVFVAKAGRRSYG